MSTPPASPVACTLTPQQLREQRRDLLPGLIERAAEVTVLDDGLRLRLVAHPGLLVEVARIIEREQGCCSFLRFHIEVPDSATIILNVTGPDGTRELLRSL